MPKQNRYLVCICTRNREDSLIRLLKSLENTKYEDIQIIIVDSSFPEARYRSFDPSSHITQINPIQRVQTTKGLPGARNLAIAQIGSEEFVVFLDDDVTVPQDFFVKLNEYFYINPGIHALGVRIVNQYKTQTGIARRFLAARKVRHFGTVTRSADNIWVPDEQFGEISVEWLPGCCMVFNKEVFQELRFNELLERGPTGGYALGEDVDFSYSCSRKFKIAATDSITIIHHFEKSSRDDANSMSVASGMFKAHLKNTYPASFSDLRIISSQIIKYAWVYKGYRLTKILSLVASFSFSYIKERAVKSYSSKDER
jgi:glycosyltransferase involved in cell wall biosynthesis